jgi:glycosyltransferase involved in cell wall biosynthesis
MFAAVIPTYNEELTIASLIVKTKRYVELVIVVDDGSNDETAMIAGEVGAHVIRLENNMGKAYAVKMGIAEAVRRNYSVVMLDGDGQHAPEDIPAVVSPVREGRADLVIGSRFLDRNTKEVIPAYRQIGQKILTSATNIMSSCQVTDSQSGFRAVSLEALKQIEFITDGFNLESDMICQMIEKGYRILEVPISVRYDIPHPHTKSPLAHGLSVLSNILTYYVYTRPLLYFSVIGLVSGIVALYFGSTVIHAYWKNNTILLGSLMVTIFFTLFSFNAINSGIVLNYVIQLKKRKK